MPTTATNQTFNIDRKVSIVIANNKGNAQIFADSNAAPPAEFELLTVGMWRTPWHGDIMIMPEDLAEYVEHFTEGLAVSGNGKLKLPINYGHNQSGKAAGWFVPVVVGDKLMATQVEWTPAGAQSLKDGEWKCISAEFYPAGRGGWIDPLDEDHIVENVLEGAALTNIPLYSNLNPVMASASSSEDNKPQVFVLGSNTKEVKVNNVEEKPMSLDEIRVKAAADLTTEEKAFLEANKAELSDAEKSKFGIQVQASTNTNPVQREENTQVNANLNDEDLKVLASIRSGDMKLIEASKLEQLEQSSQDYRTERATQTVKAHIARGAIKADQEETWVKHLLASANKEDREAREKMLSDLPGNPAFASSQGSEDNAADATDAITEMQNKAKEIMADHNKNLQAGEASMTFAQAQDRAMQDSSDLKARVEAQRNGR